ncbi:bacteriocin [Delftia lacustris]|uniref:bacteriocin n=1 Tax=Delftia lacustris TaxID=558537 RepID=UPI003B975991
MNASNKPSIPPVTADAVEDEDLAEQARPGHGVPSQDPEAAAQYQLSPQDAQRESRSVFIGGGVLAGAAAGAAAGAVIAGPVGVVVGGTVGSVAGALGGAAAGAVAPAESAQSQWKSPCHPAASLPGDTGRPLQAMCGAAGMDGGGCIPYTGACPLSYPPRWPTFS